MRYGQIAQSVEQRTENPRVGGSIPSLTTFKPFDFIEGLFVYNKINLLLSLAFVAIFTYYHSSDFFEASSSSSYIINIVV